MKQDPLIGTQIRDYLIQSRLGEGGMARVYKAYHKRLRREAAIKIILSDIAHNANFQARFEQEAQLIANLQHPNIVSIYDFGEEHDLTYLVMQYVGGGTLRENLPHGRPLEARRAIHYTLQMARALHHAHQHGIVHRDVKPQNMLLSSDNPHQLLLSDFGIAKIFDHTQEETHTGDIGDVSQAYPLVTSAGQIVGTAAYMAPEQVNRQPVDARTDVYALGVVLYQMLTGYA
ncbi:MAG TPA: serine/threonine-protein kinase, partial [Ktedonobacteraceae bacterium]|nr:serine/threonine-protein kinase [Ktedonobacteraceae bacterium]